MLPYPSVMTFALATLLGAQIPLAGSVQWRGSAEPLAEAPSQIVAADPRAREIDRYLTTMTALGRFNGTALVAEGNRVLVHAGYGLADIEWSIPASTTTRYRVASVSKQFGAMAALLLATKGELDLDAPIAMHLTGLPASWAPITTRQLIHHTSGIPDYEEWFDGYTTQSYSDFMAAADVPRRIIERAKGLPLDFSPGFSFRYSNTAYLVLGEVIEAAAGTSFETFCAQAIFRPLGMRSTSQDRHSTLIPQRARGYALAPGLGDSQLYRGVAPEHLVNANYQRMQPPQPDAGLITTAWDLYLWDQALHGEQLTASATIEAALTPGLGNYAFGWFVYTTESGPVHRHTGGLPGFSSQIYRAPSDRRSVILLSNLEYMESRVLADVLGLLRGETRVAPTARPIIPRTERELESFAGSYVTSDGGSLFVDRKSEHLRLRSNGRVAYAYPEPEDTFYVVFDDDDSEAVLHWAHGDGQVVATLEDLDGEVLVKAMGH